MAQGVDVVLHAGPEELAPSAAFFRNPSRGARYRIQAPQSGEVAEPVALYDGKERFLVRTALLRHRDFHGGSAPKLGSPAAVARLCRHLAMMDQEHMATIAVNARMQLVAIHEVAVGPSDRLGIQVRDIVKIPMLTSAMGFSLVHNHPSGQPTPSAEDRAMTEAVEKAAQCIGVTMLDHVIVAADGWYSIHYEELGTW
jgi:DNA repair protein RadC